MSDEWDIGSLTVTNAAKLLKTATKGVRAHIRRDLPLLGPALPRLGRASGRMDPIMYGVCLNQQEDKRKADDP